MKLVDLLLEKLVDPYDFPMDAARAFQDHDGQVRFERVDGSEILMSAEWGFNPFWFPITENAREACEAPTHYVTCEEFHIAKKASNAWFKRGELPPVYEKVTFAPDFERYHWDEDFSIPETGTEVEVLAHRMTSDNNMVAVVFWDDNGAARAGGFIAGNFEPIPDPTEETILAVASYGLSYQSAKEIVTAILDGKIPVKTLLNIK